MFPFDQRGAVPSCFGSTPGDVADAIERALRRYDATTQCVDERVAFYSPWWVQSGPLFFADSGEIRVTREAQALNVAANLL